jgi:hypothetical protein
VLLASLLDGASLDLLAPFPDAITSPEVDVSRGEIVQALPDSLNQPGIASAEDTSDGSRLGALARSIL